MRRNASPAELEQPPITLEDEEEVDETVIRQSEVGDIAALEDPDFQDVVWSVWRYRTDDDMRRDPKGDVVEFVGKTRGPIDAEAFLLSYGGGTFDVRGYVKREYAGKTRTMMGHRFRQVTVAGPRKDFAQVPPPVVPPTPLVVTPQQNGSLRDSSEATEKLLREMLENQRRNDDRFMALLTALATKPAEAPPPQRETKLADIITAVASLKQMSGNDGGGNSQMDVVKSVFDAFRQGLEIGQEREPISADGRDPNSMVPVIEKAIEVFGQMLRRPTLRPVPPPPRAGQSGQPPPTAPPPPPSEATVVEDATPATAYEHRVATAVQTLYRGMLHGKMPEDIAASIEDMLDESEVAQLRGEPGQEPTADQVLASLAPLVAQYPQLATEQGKVYVTAVLTALRAVDEPV